MTLGNLIRLVALILLLVVIGLTALYVARRLLRVALHA
jgi:hypothetical protein